LFTPVRTAREFCKKGLAVLRFDFRGVGDSEGSFNRYSQKSMLEDFDAALSFVRKLKGIDKGRIGALGWSMGGSTAIIGSARHPEIKCIVSWAAPADHESLWSQAAVELLRRRKTVFFDSFYGMPAILKSVMDDFRWKAYMEIKKTRAAILLINGTEDYVVYSTEAERLYRNANRPKRLLLIKGANHGFANERHRKMVISESIKWFKQWL